MHVSVPQEGHPQGIQLLSRRASVLNMGKLSYVRIKLYSNAWKTGAQPQGSKFQAKIVLSFCFLGQRRIVNVEGNPTKAPCHI